MAKIEIYDNLDAPVHVWERVLTTDDYSYLLVKRKKPDDKLQVKLDAAWLKMYSEFIDEFGFSEQFIERLKKEVEIAILNCELVKTDDRGFETEIEIAQIELDGMNIEKTRSNFIELKIAIEKSLGFQLNMRETTIREFYGYLNELK